MKKIHEELNELISLKIKEYSNKEASPEELTALAELVKASLSTIDFAN